MADQSHLDIIRQGVEAWNSWRLENYSVAPDLRGANLSGADLSGAYLTDGDLVGADLSGADLSGALLTDGGLGRANLVGAHLVRAHLNGVRFSEANLSEANLREVNLREASSFNANLSRADLTKADLLRAFLSGANLSGANLTGAFLGAAYLGRANLTGAELSMADLSRSILVQTNLERARLVDCSIHGISAWNLNLEGAKQENLNVSGPGEPDVFVDNLEVAQFIYLLLNNEKIRDVLNTIGEKGVLILGRFTEERKRVLDAIRDRLRELGFVPMMFDFERPSQQDFDETIKTLAGLSRFIIADITNPKAAPLELQAIMPNYMVPFVPIIHEDEEPFAMFQGLQHKYGEWVLDVLEYDSAANLVEVLDEAVVRPALDKSNQLLPKKAEEIRKRRTRDYQIRKRHTGDYQ